MAKNPVTLRRKLIITPKKSRYNKEWEADIELAPHDISKRKAPPANAMVIDLNISIPGEFFDKPAFRIDVSIPDTMIPSNVIPAEVQDSIVEDIKKKLDISVTLNVIQEP